MFTSLIKFLIDPFNILWILLVLCVVAWFFKKEKVMKWTLVITGVWFMLISTPLVPNMLLLSLENQYEPILTDDLDDIKAEYHIIVLGAGHGFNAKMPANTLLSHSALGRLNEGIRLNRMLPNSKLIFSGFSTVGNITGAEMLKEAALLLGVKEEVILLQEEPINTYQEAMIYAEKFADAYPVILVTSAIHMPRAMLSFNQQGITPIPSPTNYKLKGERRNRWLGLPSISHIDKISISIYEYAGIFWYNMKDSPE